MSAKRLGAWSGLLAVALLLGTALIVSSVTSYRNLEERVEVLALAQGEAHLAALRLRAPPQSGPPSQAILDQVYGEERARGLRFIGLVAEDGRVLAWAGEPRSEEDLRLDLPQGGHVLRAGNRFRMSATPPMGPPPGHPPPGGPPPGGPMGGPPPDGPPMGGPPPGGPMGGPPPGGPMGGPPPGGPPPDGPRLYFAGDAPPCPGCIPRFPPLAGGPGGRPVIEFEPQLANDLLAGAARHLGVSVLGAVALMVAAGILYRMAIGAAAAEQRLASQRHLAALGEMSAVLAHEIRNPLAALKGHAQLLAEEVPESGRERKRADRVLHEAIRLEVLTNQLLDFVRSGEVQRADVAPAALVEEVAAAVSPDRIALRLDAAPSRWSLDPVRMRQVVTNLLINAIEASPPDERVAIEVVEDHAELALTVRDRGRGIPRGHEEQIFEAFHTTRVQGTGLGLAVARRIVELHGGTIRASNRPDGGAEFRVSIPRA